jgi:hypothetical protein
MRLWIKILLGMLLLQGQFALAGPLNGERLQQVKRDTALFSKIVGEVLKQSFDNPFALSVEPQGSYLEGYGVSISFLLRINRGSIRGIYGETRYPENSRNAGMSKEEKLALVKKITSRTLVDYGGTIRGLDDEDRVSISAHIEDRNEWDSTDKMTIIVVSSTKKEINQMSKEDLSDADILRQLNTLEY